MKKSIFNLPLFALFLITATAQAQTQPGIQDAKVLLPQARFERIGVLEA